MHVLPSVLAMSFAAVTMSSAQSSTKQVFPGANPALPFSAAVKADGLVYVSGTLGSAGDMTAQTKAVLDNGAAVLKAAGFAYTDVVASRVYISDQAAFQDMNKVYQSYFPTDPPARATVKALLTSPDYIVEITMVAVKGAGHAAFTTPSADGKPGTKNPNLSSAIKAGNRLYVAGILGNTADNKGDVKAQTAESLVRIGRTLKAAGYDWKDVVEGVVYLPDLTKFNDMNASYREVFGKDFPARATVGAGLMGADAAVEIMLTAAK